MIFCSDIEFFTFLSAKFFFKNSRPLNESWSMAVRSMLFSSTVNYCDWSSVCLKTLRSVELSKVLIDHHISSPNLHLIVYS